MTAKHFSIIFVLVLLAVAGGLFFSKLQSSSDSNATPSASPSDISLFGQSTNTNAIQPLSDTSKQYDQLGKADGSNTQVQQQNGTALNNPSNQQPTLQQTMYGNQQQNNQQVQGAQTPVRHFDKFPGTYPQDQLANKKAVIVTNKGTIEFELFPDAPMAASNFIFLTLNHFYDGLTFHRVVPGFVVQGGDPNGNGTGGPGYQFNDEQVTRKYDKGIVAMANSGPNTNGSQFFIMLDDNPSLPPNYTIFGKVIKGQDVVDKIAVGDVMQQVVIQQMQ